MKGRVQWKFQFFNSLQRHDFEVISKEPPFTCFTNIFTWFTNIFLLNSVSRRSETSANIEKSKIFKRFESRKVKRLEKSKRNSVISFPLPFNIFWTFLTFCVLSDVLQIDRR